MILLDAAPAVLPPMGEKLGKKAQARLEKLGVEIQLNAMVTDVDRNGITVKDPDGTIRRIEAACKVWSAGVSASPLGRDLAEQSGVELDRAGRVKVLPDLSIPGHPNVFVVGDMAAVEGVPGMAQGAIQGGKYAAKAIEAGLKGADPDEREPFNYFDKGSMATVSRFSAVAKIGPLEFERLHRLAGLAGAAPGLPGRLQDQDRHTAVLDGDVPVDQAGSADHHRTAGLRADTDRGTRGDRRRRAGHGEGRQLEPVVALPGGQAAARGQPQRDSGGVDIGTRDSAVR